MKFAKQWNKPYFYVLGNEKFSLVIDKRPISEDVLGEILSKKQFNNRKLVKTILSDYIKEINKTFDMLKKWRKQKSKEQNIPAELIMSLLTIKFLSRWYSDSDTTHWPQIKGITRKFWDENKDEIDFLD